MRTTKKTGQGYGRGRTEGPARGRTEGPARGRTEGTARGRAEGPARPRAEGPGRFRSEGTGRPRPEGPGRFRSEGTGRPRPESARTESAPKPAAKKKRIARPVRPVEAKSDSEKATAQEARTLSGRATRYLRGLGHHLDPIIQIGKEGITDGLVAATRAALLAHELVKVKVLAEAPIDRKLAGVQLAERAGAALAQTLGRTVLLYKRHPHKPKIALPR